MLDKDSINVNNPNNDVLTPTFDLAGRVEINSSKTVSTSITNSYNVTHFIEASAGVKVVVNVGGSGIEGSYEFKTRKSFGQNVANTNNNSTTIAYRLYDDDAGDLFKVKIVRDPDYGTPIFLTSAGTKSSGPYEGGYQRDQPLLKFSAAPASSTYTVPNGLKTSACKLRYWFYGTRIIVTRNDIKKLKRTYLHENLPTQRQ